MTARLKDYMFDIMFDIPYGLFHSFLPNIFWEALGSADTDDRGRWQWHLPVNVGEPSQYNRDYYFQTLKFNVLFLKSMYMHLLFP